MNRRAGARQTAGGFYPDPQIGLRNHIPISGPATREPVDGSEGFLRASIGFTPNWFNNRVGVRFDERWHTDPTYRAAALATMRRYLHAAFPSVPHFPPVPTDAPDASCWTLSGVYGILTIPRLYAIQPQYSDTGWPDARGGMTIAKNDIDLAQPIDLDANPAWNELHDQMQTISRVGHVIHGYLNYQGLLNIAVKVRGSEFFVDMIDDPDWAKRFLSHIADTIGRVSKRVQSLQRASGFAVDLLSMSNCVMNMVSPEQYEQFVLPLDVALSRQYPRFGVHTCRWTADPYLDSLRKIPKMGYIDTGIDTDLERLRRLFPTTRRAVLYDPVALESQALSAIAAAFRRIATDCGPCDIVLADIESTTGDSRVRDILGIIAELDGEFGAHD